MHMAGLAHSDLSYKNVLVDPAGGHASIIDVDGLVVPGRFPPDVVGTPDFIAPEVVMTSHLPAQDKQRKLPSINTDRHALRCSSTCTSSIAIRCAAARSTTARTRRATKPCRWAKERSGSRIPGPYRVAGPYLRPLFESAFGDGLRNPISRPTAGDWEDALVKTIDLIQPAATPPASRNGTSSTIR